MELEAVSQDEADFATDNVDVDNVDQLEVTDATADLTRQEALVATLLIARDQDASAQMVADQEVTDAQTLIADTNMAKAIAEGLLVEEIAQCKSAAYQKAQRLLAQRSSEQNQRDLDIAAVALSYASKSGFAAVANVEEGGKEGANCAYPAPASDGS